MTRLLPLLFLLFSFSLIGQINQKRVEVYTGPIVQVQDTSKQKKDKVHKALGDTLYYEDFSDSTLANWTAYTLSGPNTYNWIWSKTAPGGQYSFNMPPLSSPTSSNGFISLPADYYNTAALMFDPMDAWIVSNAIPITPSPSVDLSFRQFLRYCCYAQNPIEVQVSNDSINWTALDAKNGRRANEISPNGEKLIFHAIPALANQNTAYIRFRMTGNSHYFWMVDDVTLTEGYTSALQLQSARIDYFPTHQQQPQYTSLAPGLFCDPQITAKVVNLGAKDHTGVSLRTKLHSKPTGQSNYTVIHSQVTNLPSISSGSTITVLDSIITSFPATLGDFYFSFELNSDSILQNQQIILDTSLTLNMVNYDTVIARDQNNFNLTLSAAVFASYTPMDGDAWAEYYELGNGNSGVFFPTSIAVFIANDSNNIGVSIQPNIWEIHADTIAASPVATSTFSTTITSNMLGSWVNLPFFPPPPFLGTAPYAAGVVQTAGASNGKYLVLGRDTSVEKYSPLGTNFVGFASSGNSPNWGNSSAFAGIRVNGEAWHVYSPCNMILSNSDLVKEETKVSIYPNPSEGVFTIEGGQAGDLIVVRDVNGRMVYSENARSDQHSLDLNFLQNGLYFLHIKGKHESVEKVIINRH